jgi:hypothetical protein
MGKKTTYRLICSKSSPIRQHNVNKKTHTTQGERGKIFLFNNSQISLNLTMSPSPKKKKKKNVSSCGNTERRKNWDSTTICLCIHLRPSTHQQQQASRHQSLVHCELSTLISLDVVIFVTSIINTTCNSTNYCMIGLYWRCRTSKIALVVLSSLNKIYSSLTP